VPQPIIDRKPTAGLWPGQTDEGEIGLTYDELDDVVEALGRGDVSALRPAAVELVRRLNQQTDHKRSAMPVYVPTGGS
jgi:NAD+ synthase